jgi:carboxypeptidase C (cathepsin A)
MNQGEGVTISLPKIKGTLNGRSDKGKSISNDQIFFFFFDK